MFKSSYLCSPIRKEKVFCLFFFLFILSLSHRESEKRIKRKTEKTSEKVW